MNLHGLQFNVPAAANEHLAEWPKSVPAVESLSLSIRLGISFNKSYQHSDSRGTQYLA